MTRIDVYAELHRALEDDRPPGPSDPGIHHVLRHVSVGAAVLAESVSAYQTLQGPAAPDRTEVVATAADIAAVLQSALRDTDAFAQPWTGGDPLEFIDVLEQLLYSLVLLTDDEHRSLALRSDELRGLLAAPTVASLLRDLPD